MKVKLAEISTCLQGKGEHVALFTMTEVRQKAAAEIQFRTAERILIEEAKSYSPGRAYDIFLSHCFKDAAVVVGIVALLREIGLSVYVDWLEDAHLRRDRVSKDTAELVKQRMKSSRALFFASSEQSPNSKWMPWELGYFDGLKGKVAVLPIVETGASSDSFSGQEYLGIYPYVTKGPHPYAWRATLFVRTSSTLGIPIDQWLAGGVGR